MHLLLPFLVSETSVCQSAWYNTAVYKHGKKMFVFSPGTNKSTTDCPEKKTSVPLVSNQHGICQRWCFLLYPLQAVSSTFNSYQQPSFTDDTKFHWPAISWLNCPCFLVGTVVNTTNKKCALYFSHQLLQVNKFSNLWLVYLALGNVVSLITQSCQEQLCLWGRFCSQLQTRA